jgi:branched-chain amino acid transport system substrate-binding protein
MNISTFFRCIIPGSLLVFLLLLTGNLQAQQLIKVGMSAALSGPYEDYGVNMKLGVEVYFNRINRSGGFRGKKLSLVAFDDGYIPELAKKNMERFIRDTSILAVIGSVGTPTAEVTVPLANEEEILLFGSYTGAELLRKSPPDRYVINYRASYAQETSLTIDYLLSQGILPYQIAFFTQDDGYGNSCYASAMKALERHGFYNKNLIVHGRYDRNTLDINDALIKIISAPIKPKAIVMAGTSGPCSKFISIARKYLPEVIFTNVSFVGASSLKEALGPNGEGVIISQVVPIPDKTTRIPVVKDYLKDLERYFRDNQMSTSNATPSFVSLEGYIVAKIFVSGLAKAGENANRESIIDAILKDHDIGLNHTISFDKVIHQGSQRVWLTKISGDGFEMIEMKE